MCDPVLLCHPGLLYGTLSFYETLPSFDPVLCVTLTYCETLSSYETLPYSDPVLYVTLSCVCDPNLL